MTLTYSPLIKHGKLHLNANGDLESAPDIETQMAVTFTAYHCMYNNQINSKVIPFFRTFTPPRNRRNTLTNIIVQAYKILLTNRVISSPQIFIRNVTMTMISVTIKVIDISGNGFVLLWDNQTNNLQIQSGD